jgi:hypothetical protein
MTGFTILAATVAISLLAVGCGTASHDSNATAQVAVQSTQVSDESQDQDGRATDEEIAAKVQELRQTPVFKEALARHKGCMERLGYVYVTDRQFYYKDGTFEDFDNRKPRPQSGPFLEWLIDTEGCGDEAGLTALYDAAGIQLSDEPDPELIRRSNEYTTKLMRCMSEKGWAIPEPRRFRDGRLAFDVIALQTGPDAGEAWKRDMGDCSAQVGPFAR